MLSFQVPVLGSTVRFFSLFPASLPQPFHRCLPSGLTSGIFHFKSAFFRPLLFRFQLLSLLFFFSLSSCLRLTVASSVLRICFRFFGFPRSLQPDLSCFPSRFLYSALLLVSFHPSLIRSRSCSSGASLALSPSGFSASLPVPFVPFCSASGYLAFCFFLSALHGSASQWLPRCAASTHASTVFPVRPSLVSHALLPVLVLGFLFVSFRPSRFRSHSCSTGASLLFRFRFSSGLFRLPSGSLRPLRPASDYSAFRAFLSPLPDLP